MQTCSFAFALVNLLSMGLRVSDFEFVGFRA